MKKILCIGAGYVGGPTMAVVAAKCPDYQVTVVDQNAEKIAAWNSDHLPIYEPGLDELVFAQRGKNLFYSTDIIKGIKEADIIFVSVNTPTKLHGIGAGKASDLQYIEKAARMIAEHAETDKVVVEKSTLPVRTAAALERILSQNAKGRKFSVVSNPEFLAEGTAIEDLFNPDRVLIGGSDTPEGRHGVDEIVAIYAQWVPRDRIVTTNLWSSELTKLVSNALLAQRISAVNGLSALCEETGADIDEVAAAAGRDKRIGSKFLKAGIGFGGSCFKKDLLNLVYLCEFYGLPEVAAFWENVLKINEFQAKRFVQKILSNMFNTVTGKKIAIFGYAFKENTGDTRETPSKTVADLLINDGAVLAIHDPKALPNARTEMAYAGDAVTFCEDPYEAVKDAHALLVLTPWECFNELDYKKIFDSMSKPAFLFDGRNKLDHNALFEMGFNVFPIGKDAKTHF